MGEFIFGIVLGFFMGVIFIAWKVDLNVTPEQWNRAAKSCTKIKYVTSTSFTCEEIK